MFFKKPGMGISFPRRPPIQSFEKCEDGDYSGLAVYRGQKVIVKQYLSRIEINIRRREDLLTLKAVGHLGMVPFIIQSIP